MGNPIYDELADNRGVDVPEDPIDWFTPGTLEQSVSGQAPGVEYAGYTYYANCVRRTAPVDVPERVDGWCEDRPTDRLTNHDGVD